MGREISLAIFVPNFRWHTESHFLFPFFIFVMSTQSTDSQREATSAPSQAASTPAAPTKAVQVKLVLLGKFL
jgi:hypothetical protein